MPVSVALQGNEIFVDEIKWSEMGGGLRQTMSTECSR